MALEFDLALPTTTFRPPRLAFIVNPSLAARTVGPSEYLAACFAAGDFNTPASNGSAMSHTAYVTASPNKTDLFQTFQKDPQAMANIPNFVPNFVPHPLGADLTAEGLPVPPASQGVPPRVARSF